MTSAALYEAAIAFLEGEVLAAINQEQPGLLAAGSVTATRAPKKRFARRDKPTPTAVEIVLVSRRDEAEGVASDRITLEFDLRCLVRQKDATEGKQQARTTDEMARALVRHFRRTAEIPLNVPGATFRHADARLLHVDDEQGSNELARSIVRLTLTFSEVLE